MVSLNQKGLPLMWNRILIALGIRRKPSEETSKPKSSALNRLQRQSAFTAVNIEELKAKRRGQPPR